MAQVGSASLACPDRHCVSHGSCHEESGDEEGYEGNEGDEGHEEESHEEKGNESQQDRQGQACESFGLPRNQSEDAEWPGEVGYDEEQVRQDREREGIGRFQEEVCHQRAEEMG